jgi:hypothetical protein
MEKVIGFTRRNPRLTYDEYRAAHLGHHCSYGRRLRNIRGYLFNAQAPAGPLRDAIRQLPVAIERDPPDGFTDTWSAYGQLNFDSLDDYFRAMEGEPDHATPGGLVIDPLVRRVGGDGDDLYGGSPFQFRVDERVVVSVRRPEAKVTKIVQFVRRQPGLSREAFRDHWFGTYAQVRGRFPGLRGCILNFRDDTTDVMSGFVPPSADFFTPEGTAAREAFYALWDGFAELWYDSLGAFVDGHAQAPVSAALVEAEAPFIAASWYIEVDESVVVMPNRGTVPPYYYR